MKPPSLAYRLLRRGDVFYIANGELFLEPASGKVVCCVWRSENRDSLIKQATTQLGISALKYESYSTGRYGEHRAPGITLQFHNLVNKDDSYAIFNVDLDRDRNSKAGRAGTSLPRGQFRVGKRSHFYTFWQNSGLKMPPRLSSFHDYMGNMKRLVFTGEHTKGKRLNTATLRPLNIPYELLLMAFNLSPLPDKPQTASGHQPDNCHTRLPYKDFRRSQQARGLQPLTAAGEAYCGTSNQGDTGTRTNVNPMGNDKRPEDQSTDEWIAALESAHLKGSDASG